MNIFIENDLLQVLKNCWTEIPKEVLAEAVSKANLSDEEIRAFINGVKLETVCTNVDNNGLKRNIRFLEKCEIFLENHDYVLEVHNGFYDLTVSMTSMEYAKFLTEAHAKARSITALFEADSNLHEDIMTENLSSVPKNELLYILKKCWPQIPDNTLKNAIKKTNLTENNIKTFIKGSTLVEVCKNVDLEELERCHWILNKCDIFFINHDYVKKFHNGLYDLSIVLNDDEYAKFFSAYHIHSESPVQKSSWYNEILEKLPTSPDAAMQGYWKNDEDEIMCKTEAAANALADFLTAAGLDICACCYNADLDVATEDNFYGWWAVYCV